MIFFQICWWLYKKNILYFSSPHLIFHTFNFISTAVSKQHRMFQSKICLSHKNKFIYSGLILSLNLRLSCYMQNYTVLKTMMLVYQTADRLQIWNLILLLQRTKSATQLNTCYMKIKQINFQSVFPIRCIIFDCLVS